MPLPSKHITANPAQPPPFEEPLPVSEPVEDFPITGTTQLGRRNFSPTAVSKPPRNGWQTFWRIITYSALGAAILGLAVFCVIVYGYWYIVRSLPAEAYDLRDRASKFETARVYDGQGNLLYEIVDPQAGRRTYVPLKKISPYLIAATIATEDKDFYTHPGFDPIGITRAIWQNVQARGTVSGASTIAQQLVRALVFTPEEASQRTAWRKIREIVLAAEITRRYDRDTILELYLNEIYYGNLAYGIEAASETYFNTHASDLTLGRAAFLAGLPQLPAVYDVFTDADTTFARQNDVLALMLTLTNERDGIEVSTQPGQPIRVTSQDMIDARTSVSNHAFVQPRNDARFPHWVNYIRQLLEKQYGANIYRSGYSVYTTLDPVLQTTAEQIVAEQVAALADRNVTNGALVALRPTTGEIVAMVGSDDYDDPKDGQINMALRPRQPGSSIKPLTYSFAFEKGWTPATLIWDVPTDFPDGANPPYKPVNYDGRFHGPVLMRSALANSYNIPAVKALQFVGLYGGEGFVKFAETLGVDSLTREDYGLSLTLGGGEVPLIEMMEAYGALANGGRRVFSVAILKVTDLNGKVVCQQSLTSAEADVAVPLCQTPPEIWGQQVVSPETAYLISDILSDNNARTPAFGPNSPLRLSFPAAVKTGTTNDYRDNWTIGYTPDLVTGVWVGNADYTEMRGTSGVTGAAPIWKAFMETALAGKATSFARPPAIIEKNICAISGAEPSDFCPIDQRRTEIFAVYRPPLPPTADLWQNAYIDSFTGLRQTADCAKAYQNDELLKQQKLVIAVSDPFAQKWLTEDPNGQAWAGQFGLTPPIAWAPTADCTLDSPRPIVSLSQPVENAVLTPGVMPIVGQAAATQDFDHFIIEYGLSHDPIGWGVVQGPNANPFPEVGKLVDWDASGLPDGPVTVRVIVFNKSGGSAEAQVKFLIQRPTPTPEPTATPTSTPTITPTPSSTPTPTATPPASATPVVAAPTATPTALAPTSTLAPTVTDTPPAPTHTPTPTSTSTP